MRSRLALVALVSLCAGSAARADSPLQVVPVLFVPRDTAVDAADLRRTAALLDTHLALARDHYRAILKTTFEVAGRAQIYRSARDDAYFAVARDARPDSAHRMTAELLAWKRQDRRTAGMVFVAVYVRPAGALCAAEGEGACMGGGRTFNGPPNSGGGFVQLEHASLVRDVPYPFQSTLVHELGHAFGLAHVDCHGFELDGTESIMSYNPAHHSRGLLPSATPGALLPEDLYALAQNTRAFPGYRYDPRTANPTGRPLQHVEACYLGPMDASIGVFDALGYKLLHDGRVVSGPEAAFWTVRQARENCQWNLERHPKVRVECRYNGERLPINRTTTARD
jgi:hypothetical protein